MEKDRLKQLVDRYRNGILSAPELQELQGYISHVDFEADVDDIFDRLMKEADLETNRDQQPLAFDKVKSAIESLPPTTTVRRSRKLIYRVSSVAAAIIIATTSTLVWKAVVQDRDVATQNHAATQTMEKVTPGSSKAVIILDDGKEIDLETVATIDTIRLDGYWIVKNEQGEITYQIDSHYKGVRNAYHTIVVPQGGEYKLKLPDQSTVWLNAASSLRYPVEFGTVSRELTLKGEAYFAVKKLKNNTENLPFIVHTGSQKLEVLGTEFNINSYRKEIKTTLIEGNVALSFANGEQRKLKPNQQAIYQEDKETVHVQVVDPYYSIAWKEGSLAYDNATLEELMESIARWYDVSVVYDKDPSKKRFSGAISRYEDIDKLLKTIEMTNTVTFERKGRRVMVRI